MKAENRLMLGHAGRVGDALQRRGLAIVVCLASAACHSPSPQLASGSTAMEMTGVAHQVAASEPYRIGPADDLHVRVLYEPDLSLDTVRVSTDGTIEVPLAGTVPAMGRTAAQLAADIEERLRRYVLKPNVIISVTDYARQFVVVEGSVEDPGRFDVRGTSSLLEALALANGPSRTAKLDEVMVFRTIGGRRAGARFDLNRIRLGYEPDPLVLGGDTVVVGYSEVKGAFRDFLTVSPALGVFRPY
jgi:polysaccharide biosynthesis/export protein